MSGPGLTVERRVIVEMVRLAAIEVSGVLRVGRAGPLWRRWLFGRSIVVHHVDDAVEVRLRVVARPGQPLVPLTREVRATIGTTIERLLGLRTGAITIVVDGVGS
jgi:uncharacterized alkaline shock family protein YloU